ncbi:MAG: hypothetical protein ACJ72P_05120, partial [Nocardioides sp.]
AVPTVALGATPAQAGIREAGQHPWASRVEFGDVRGGWSLAHVQDHFDTRGTFQYQGGGQLTRTYKGWRRNIEVSVTYKRVYGVWRVGHDRYGVWKYAYNVV